MASYQPSLETTNHNVTPNSHWNVLKIFLVSVVLVSGAFWALSYAIVPFISPEQERSLFGNLEPYLGQVNDLQTEYVRGVFEKLEFERDDDVSYSVEVVCNDEFNAFATVGAKIVILSGLLENAESENEVAFVLAHELSHVQHRDVLHNIISTAPLEVLSVFVFGDTISASSIQNILHLRYRKNMELRSDREGLHALYDTYGHVGGALTFFEAIQAQGESDFLTAFSDHPLTSTRIERMREMIDRYEYEQKSTIPIPAEIRRACDG